jgi:hypothetical protein
MPAAAPRLPTALRALLEAGGALVRRSASGRMALARAAALVDPAALPGGPAELPAPLADARAAADAPLDEREAERRLKRVVAAWDAEPLAVAPASQVHRGTTDDGDAVAVKLQRPGLAAGVRSDLALLDALAGPLRQAFRALDAGALLREVREAALDELDLEHEASNQRQARRALRGVDGLVVPAPDLSRSDEDVLVTELLDGPTLADAAPDDPGRAARTLLAAHVTAARAGIALTDPRPSHVILLAGGDVGLLGTGAARPVDRERVAAGLDAAAALRAGDEDAFADAVAGRLRLLPDPAARKAYVLLGELLDGLLSGPATLDAAALRGIAERAVRRLDPLVDLAAVVTPRPADLGAARSLLQLAALLARLEATEDWGALLAA